VENRKPAAKGARVTYRRGERRDQRLGEKTNRAQKGRAMWATCRWKDLGYEGAMLKRMEAEQSQC